MTAIQVRAEIKKLVIAKGLDNILCADLNKLHDQYGATYGQMQNAISYFKYSPMAKKYRAGA